MRFVSRSESKPFSVRPHLFAGTVPPTEFMPSTITSSSSRPGVWPGGVVHVEAKEGHSHECEVPGFAQHQVFLLLESDGGRMRQRRGGVVFEGVPQPGDITIVPAFSGGHCHSEAKTRTVQVRLQPAWLEEVGQSLASGALPLAVRFAVHDEKLKNLILLLHQEFREREADARGASDNLMVDSLSTALAVQLLRHHAEKHASMEETTCDLCGGLSARAQRQVLEYVEDNLAEEVSLDAMAGVVGLSRYHFLRSFKASFGLTPHQYVIEQRVELAKTLIGQGRFSLRDIAHRSGFSDQSHLTRHFRRLTGATPKAFGAASP